MDHQFYNNLLEYALNQNTCLINLNEFLRFLEEKSLPVDKYYLIEKLKLTRGFFKVENQNLIEITTKPIVCYGYNSKQRRCEKKDCKYLHICLNLFKNNRYCNCGLNHSMQASYIKPKLVYRNMALIDYEILMSYFKHFVNNNSNSDEVKSSLNSRPKAFDNILRQNQSIINVASSINSQDRHKVEIQLSEEFVSKYNEHILFALLNRTFLISDNDIHYKQYKPKELKAIIIYNDESTAQKLINKKELDFIGLKISFKECLAPPELQKPIKQIEKKDKTEKINKKHRFVKTLANNTLLRLILRNENWKNGLIESIKQVSDCEIKINAKELIVITTNQIKPIDDKIGNFCGQFTMKQLIKNESNSEILKDIIRKIEEIKIYTIAYEEKENPPKLYLVGEKAHIDDFFSRSNILDKLESVSSIVTQKMNMPKIPISGYKGLLNLAISKLVKKFDLHDLKADDLSITLTGVKSNVESAIQCLNKTFASIKCERIEAFKNYINIINNSKNLSHILNDCLKTYEIEYLFKIKIHPNTINDPNEDEYGIFIIYFYDCPELDSNKDFVFQLLSKHLVAWITFLEMDVTKYALTLNTNKWRLFEQENFNKTKCLTNFSYTLVKDQDNQIKINLAGKKADCINAKITIEQYLSINESITRQISLTRDDFLFLKHVAYTNKKQLENQYSVSMEYKELDKNGSKEYYLIINECPNNLYDEIVTKIKNICSLKLVVKTDNVNTLPGSSAIYEKNFRNEIETISRETCTHIEVSMTTVKNSTKPKYIKTSNTKILSSLNGKNKISQTLKVGTSLICLEIGNIIDTQADVIVNSTSPNLKLHGGVLSKLILNHAGNKIQNECDVIYPNGIKVGEIAETSAGNLSSILSIFHITLSHFVDNQSCTEIIENIVSNCLKRVNANDYKSITFPAIGTGGVGYPSNIVARQMIETITKFLTSLTTSSIRVNILVSEDFPQALRDFESAFSYSSLNDNQLIGSKDFSYKKNAENYLNINFKVICRTNNEFNNVSSKLGMIFSRYIIKDNADYECNADFTEKELEIVFDEFKNTEIEMKSKRIEFKGLKDEIANAKIKITKLISEKNKSWSEQISLAKDVQWKFEASSDKWTNFSLETNHLIESAYQKKSKIIILNLTNNLKQIVWFDQMILTNESTTYTSRIQRVDLKKMDLFTLFPTEWDYMNENEYFKLVKLRSNSKEFIQIEQDFKTKLGHSNTLNKLEIHRIQNKTLYESYLNYKKRLKSKSVSENEMYLFHGTNNSSVDQIARHGFNRSYCGINGVAYGHGVYFAVNSNYSHNYTSRSSGESSMFRVRVLVGDTTYGNSSMKVAPKKSNGEHFDSTCDQSKTIFVAYHDNQCYPEYLITYKI